MSTTSASPTTSSTVPIPPPSKRSLRTNYERSPAKHVAPKSNIACRAQAMTLRVYGGKSYEEIEKLTGMKQRQVVKFINQAKELGWKPDGSDMEETMLKEEYLSAAALHKVQDKKIVEVMTSKYQVSKTTAKRSLERAKEQGWADKLREVAEDKGPTTRESTGNGTVSGERTGETDADVDAEGEPDDGMGDNVVPTTEQVSPPQSRRQPQQQQSPPQQQQPQQHQQQPQQRPQQARQQSHTNPHEAGHQHHAHTSQSQNPSHSFHQPSQHAQHNLHPQQPLHAPEEGLLEQNLRTQAMGYLRYQQLSDSHIGSPEMSMSLQGGNMPYGNHRRT